MPAVLDSACPDSQTFQAKEQAVQLVDATQQSPRGTLDRVERLLTATPADLASSELADEIEATLNEGCGQLLAIEAHAARTATAGELASSLRDRLGALRACAHPAVGSPRLAGAQLRRPASPAYS